MKYLKEYNTNTYSDRVYDVRDCFLSVMDLYDKVSIKYGYDYISVSVTLDSNVTDVMCKSEYGCVYRPVINGDLICKEIAESIAKCVGYIGLSIKSARVIWVSAGEWSLKYPENKDKCLGPGTLSKSFVIDGVNGPLRSVIKGSYSIDILDEFILDKGDRLRYVKVIFY